MLGVVVESGCGSILLFSNDFLKILIYCVAPRVFRTREDAVAI
jgi:hypothetical protein